MKFNLGEYENQSFPANSQNRMIIQLIAQLRYYIKAPINELEAVLPQLEDLEKQCQNFDAKNGMAKINYIKEILAALHEQEQSESSTKLLNDDQESLFWKMIMAFKKKIIKTKKLSVLHS